MESGVQRWAVNCQSWTPSESQFAAFLDLLPGCEHRRILGTPRVELASFLVQRGAEAATSMDKFLTKTPQRKLIQLMPQRRRVASSPTCRYVKFEDRKRALLSRLLQRRLVHTLLQVPYGDILIERTREGKPYLANRVKNCPFPNLNFNVAHHGHYVILASEPICLVGVDVMTPHEAVKDEPLPVFFKSFRECYTGTEWNMILSVGPGVADQLDQFYRLWCMKESYIKAVGIGLGFELATAEFFYHRGDVWSDTACVRINGTDKPQWGFHLHKLGDDHWACVARGPPTEAGESFKENLHRTEFDNSYLAATLAVPEKQFDMLKVWDLIPDAEKPKFKDFGMCN